MLSQSVIILGLRAAQLLFAFIILGLSAYVANWYNVDTLTSPPSQINWLLFVSLFTIISVGYLEAVPRFAPKFSHPWAAIGLELGNALFYFAGFIALSVFISKLLFCRGSVCGAAQADVAFGAFEFLLWTASAVFMGKERSSDEGGRRPVIVGGHTVLSPHYTDIPLSPYKPIVEYEETKSSSSGKGNWERVYLHVPQNWMNK
ncbi:membrane-associating domain-containing protein [Xylariaceae sp. FL0016]|nr:membrane-associating domain-containing protein [Xylariaceae sp. FL0016]